MRLIDADELKNKFRSEKRWIVKHNGIWKNVEYINEGFSYDQVMFGIDLMPTVDAEPVRHGEWEEIEIQLTWCEDDVDIIYKCSVCRENNIGESKYCPNCGAKMD